MTTIKTTRWDTAETLNTKEDIALYLDAAIEDGDPEILKIALGNVARSKGLIAAARAAGLPLPPDGRVQISTVLDVLHACGFRLSLAHV